MREFTYIMIGLLVAALPPAIFLTASIVLGDPHGLDNLIDPLILFVGLVASTFFYTLILGGIPFVILRSLNLVRWWSAVMVGILAGLGFVFLFGVAHLDLSGIIGFPFSGTASGFLFWLVWRKGQEFRNGSVA